MYKYRFCNNDLSDVGLDLNPWLQKAWANNKLSNYGVLYDLLVERLKVVLQVPDTHDLVLTSSGHMALECAALISKFLVREVTVSSFTFPSTLQALRNRNLRYAIKDCDRDGRLLESSYHPAMDDSYENKFLTAPLGTPLPDNKAIVIDAASSWNQPSLYKDSMAVIHSFHATKVLPIGEAGCIVFDKSKWNGGFYEEIKTFLNFGITPSGYITHKFKPDEYTDGTNGKISELSCAMGLALLNGRWFQDTLEHRSRLTQYVVDRVKATNNYYVTVLNSENIIKASYPALQCIPLLVLERGAHFCKLLGEELGIECKQYYKPLDPNTPNAWRLYNSMICLPCHSRIPLEVIEKAIDLIYDKINR